MRIISEKWSPYLWWTGWSPDGTALLTASADAPDTVSVRSAEGATLHALKGHEAGVNAAVWSPDGRWVATGAWDGALRLWSAAGEARTVVSLVPGGSVECVAWSPDGDRLAAACSDGRFCLLEGAFRAVARDWALAATREWDFPGGLFSLAWHPGGDRISVAGTHGWSHVRLGDAPLITGGRDAAAVEVAWRADGLVAAITCDDGSIWLDDAKAEPVLVRRLETPARGVAWHPAGVFAVGDVAGWVRVITADGEEVWAHRMSHEVVSVRWQPGSGSRLLAATRGAEAVLVDVPLPPGSDQRAQSPSPTPGH
jgi:WD40 repeat protein